MWPNMRKPVILWISYIFSIQKKIRKWKFYGNLFFSCNIVKGRFIIHLRSKLNFFLRIIWETRQTFLLIDSVQDPCCICYVDIVMTTVMYKEILKLDIWAWRSFWPSIWRCYYLKKYKNWIFLQNQPSLQLL